MELATARLRLDALHPGDAATLFAYRADPRVSRYQGWRPGSVEAAREFIERQQSVVFDTPDSWFQFAIRWRDSAELAGDLGLHFVGRDTVELGISLAPSWQGKGLAAEALAAMLDLAFGELGRHRAFASVDPRNTPCIRLLAGLGMRQEAHFRESFRDGDAWADDAIYALLAREWRARAAG